MAMGMLTARATGAAGIRIQIACPAYCGKALSPTIVPAGRACGFTPSNYGRFVRTFPLRDRGSLGATMRLLPERREVSRYQHSPLQSWGRRFVAVRQLACGPYSGETRDPSAALPG